MDENTKKGAFLVRSLFLYVSESTFKKNQEAFEVFACNQTLNTNFFFLGIFAFLADYAPQRAI